MASFKPFNQINDEQSTIINFFESKTDFLAHTHPSKEPETLHQHIIEVISYFLRLVKTHNLESVVDGLIQKISAENDKIGNFLKELFFFSIVFHDFGKTNPNFQVQRMNNNKIFETDNSIKLGYEHSFISAYFFLNFCVEKISKSNFSKSEKIPAYMYAFLFSIPIIKHHSGHLEKNYNFSEDKIESIHYLTEIMPISITKEQIQKLINYEKSDDDKSLKNVFENIIPGNFDYFPLFALLKLNYSLLTASDYLATTDYMNDLKLKTEEDFGLITNTLRQKLIQNFDQNQDTPWNGELISNPEKYLSTSLDELNEINNDILNFIRQKMGAEVLVNIEKHTSEKVFYIEAPTGGGKTNMSMIALRKMLELYPEINKVFYVFPFTTLVTQTAKAIKETFQLDDNDVAQIHSKSDFQVKKYDDEADAKYGKEKRNQIDNLFVNYPFTLMTHIKFFDVLKSNKKDTNYLLHRLANSVVIIDELQAYNPEHWDKIKYFIANYAELFNIRFIIMSATLPKIDEIELSDYKPKRFVPLIENATKYLQTPNFAGRVEIKTDLLEKTIELPELINQVFEKSKLYAETRRDKFKGSIYTIIEFIFKKSATDFYENIKKYEEENGKFFDEIFVLSGTILEPRRKHIIEFLKDKKNRKKKILLITTQVVEAGVDIDMDLGFKNQSIIDSDEQLAGRINRNVNKQNCELYLFKHDKPKSIYGKDLRYEVTEKQIKSDEVKQILTEKDFKRLYDRVFQEIFKINNSAYKKGIGEYLDNFKRIDFRGVQQDFKLIESENATIFVPIDIDINCYGNTKNFSENEYVFIRKNNCLTDENKVSGEKIWELYQSFTQDCSKKFSIENKILNGIMSKFVFSVFMKKITDLYPFIENLPTSEEKTIQQYFKLNKERLNEIYSEKSGINEKHLTEISKSTYEFI
jgi:CRISPR-associated endonuclease/helicase Cas3